MDYAETKAKNYITEAKKHLQQIDLDSDRLEILEQMSDYLIERKK